MKTILISVYLGLVLLIIGCSKPPKRNPFDKGTQETIHVSHIDCVHSDSVIKSIHFLPLESNDTCLITRVEDIKLNDSLIFIDDNRYRILVFDMSGKFLYQIGNRGQGPEEYLEIRDFLIHQDTIEILDYQKIEYYSINGKHLLRKRLNLSKKKGEYVPRYFAKAPANGYYFWEKRIREKEENGQILHYMYQTDSNFHIVRHEFPAIHKVSTNLRKFIPYDNKVILDPIFADANIYQIDSVGQISIRYSFDFGDKTVTPEDTHILKYMDFAETNHWVHLSFYWKKLAYNLFYNKLEKKAYLLSPGRKYAKDNDLRFWYVQTTYKDQMVYCIDPVWLLGERDRLSKEYQDKYGLNEGKLKNVTENSNFIVGFYTLK